MSWRQLTVGPLNAAGLGKIFAGERVWAKMRRVEVKNMLAELKEVAVLEEQEEMPSFNHSIICADIAEQIYENKQMKALPELTVDIGNSITPDLSVYERDKIKPNFRRDVTRYGEMPILAIEVISASQLL